ncbi:hypothetical protein PAXRUDRAFT_155156, partial [Paxillus rubicundulus Ve08.2h10]
DGILHCSVVKGFFCTETFMQFIRWLFLLEYKCHLISNYILDNMQPFPASNSIIVMDNCRIHKHNNIQELIESR